MKKLLKFLNREKCQVVAVVICLVALLGGITCQSKVKSILYPDRDVTRIEILAEIKTFDAQVRARMSQLDNKDRIRRQLFDLFALWSTTGQFNPAGIIPALITVLGVAAAADNVDKRKQIKKLNHAG